jgi:hypothetical protein
MSNEPQSEHSTNIIHDSLGDTTEFWGSYTLGELLLFILPVFGWLVIMGLPFLPPGAILPVTIGAIAAEIFLFLLHKVRPNHYRLTEWLRVRAFWLAKKEEYTHGEGNQDTRRLTRLKRIMPHGIERIDGAHVGAVQVRPANLALEDSDQWNQAVKSLTGLVNNFEGTAKIYVTTRDVDNTAHIQAHKVRLEDADTANHPIFRGVLMEWLNRHTADDGSVLSETEMQRQYYIIVSVTDADIDDLERDSDSVLRYLSRVPLLGRLAARFDSGELTETEREEYKAKKLRDRLTTVSRGVDSLYRCRSEPVTPYALAQLTKDYWACEARQYDDIATAASVSPITYSDREAVEAADTVANHETVEGIDSDESAFELDDATQVPPEVTTPYRDHQSLVAPTAVDWATNHAQIDRNTYTRTFWVETFPEHPTNGLFERLLLDTELQVDLSIHIDPYGPQEALTVMEEWISSLRMLQEDQGQIQAEDIDQDVKQAKYIRQMVRRNHTSLNRVGVFVRVTADSREALRTRTNKLETILRDAPANCTIKRATRRQEEGLVSVSPIGANELGSDRLSSMTGEALGSLFPFSSNYLRMEGGIEYGTHGHNSSSLLIDPWDLDTGHSELVTGMPGGGKTHGTQARAMRMMKKRPDVKQVYIDPVGDMRGSAMMLDAKTITVSGETPLNPCEMHPTPEDVLEKSPDMQPVAAKKDEVYGVIENFLEARDVDLEMHSGLITFLIDTIFEQSGIDPDDPSTHTPENSPNMRDFLELIDQLQEEPGRFPGATTESAKETIRQYADELSVALHPFRQGSTYGNLSESSDMNLIDDGSKAVYLDLQQVEGSGDGLGKQSFIMQLLLSTLYQQSKNMDSKVEIIIDEAHYLFNDSANLAFLNQIARHQRHAELRLVMLSQTLQEFYDEGVAEEIAGMCPIMVHHREPDLGDTTARKAGLTTEQQHYIQTAEAGKESIGDGQGYSQALVRVDEHGDYPLTIRTTWEEKRVIDLDAHGRDALDDLVDERSPELEEFEEFVYTHAMEQQLTEEYGMTPEHAEHVLNGLSDQELMETVSVALARTDVDAPVADGGTDTEPERNGSGSGHSDTESPTSNSDGDTSETAAPSTKGGPDQSAPAETASTPSIPEPDELTDESDSSGESIWRTESTTSDERGDTDV